MEPGAVVPGYLRLPPIDVTVGELVRDFTAVVLERDGEAKVPEGQA